MCLGGKRKYNFSDSEMKEMQLYKIICKYDFRDLRQLTFR